MPKPKKTAPRKPRKKAAPKKPNGKPEAPKLHPIKDDEIAALVDYIGISTSPKSNGEIMALMAMVQRIAQRPMPGKKK